MKWEVAMAAMAPGHVDPLTNILVRFDGPEHSEISPDPSIPDTSRTHGGCVHYGQGPLVLWRGAEDCKETLRSAAILSQIVTDCLNDVYDNYGHTLSWCARPVSIHFLHFFVWSWKLPGHDLPPISSLVYFIYFMQHVCQVAIWLPCPARNWERKQSTWESWKCLIIWKCGRIP